MNNTPSSLTIKHCRCFNNFTLELRPLTLLYGRNGTGKSTLIRLLWAFGDASAPSDVEKLDCQLASPCERVRKPDTVWDASEVLIANEDVRDEVAEWYARTPMKRTLRFTEKRRPVRLLLSPVGSSFDVDFADAGAGLNSVLPLLVATVLAKREESILAAEELGAHLHPDAQRALAEWLCECVAGDAPPRLIFETHSPVLIAAVQLAIARSPSLRHRVGAYWLEQQEDGRSSGSLVTFDALGRPEDGSWPWDAFAAERGLARELVDLRLEAAS